MQNMGEGDCPFEFNFDAKTFKAGDTVSFRVEGMDDFPFVGTLIDVHAEHVTINVDEPGGSTTYRGTREDRPLVSADQI